MILDASREIAVKCSECGKYNISEINVFNLKIPTSIHCSCGRRIVKAYTDKKNLFMEIDCIVCEEHHSFKLKLKDVMEKSVKILNCQVTGMEIAFLGKNDYITEIVERETQDMNEILKSFGVESITARVVK